MTDRKTRPYGRIGYDDPGVPLWFKIWATICAVVGVALLSLLVWAVIAIVSKVTR